jgi:hypothetical protein
MAGCNWLSTSPHPASLIGGWGFLPRLAATIWLATYEYLTMLSCASKSDMNAKTLAAVLVDSSI